MGHGGNSNLRVPTSEEARRNGRKGGKASAEARRKKANLRKNLEILLSCDIDSKEWTPFLEAMGVDSTLESAINAAMIKEALQGNVKAYTAIRDTIGQTTKSDLDIEEQEVRVSKIKSETKGTDSTDAELKINIVKASKDDEE